MLTVAGGFRAMNRQSRAPAVSIVTGSRLRSFGKYTSSLVTMRCLDHWSVPSGAVASKPPMMRIWVSVTCRPKSIWICCPSWFLARVHTHAVLKSLSNARLASE